MSSPASSFNTAIKGMKLSDRPSFELLAGVLIAAVLGAIALLRFDQVWVYLLPVGALAYWGVRAAMVAKRKASVN